MSDSKRVSVTLTNQTIDYLLLVGEGNISRGVYASVIRAQCVGQQLNVEPQKQNGFVVVPEPADEENLLDGWEA